MSVESKLGNKKKPTKVALSRPKKTKVVSLKVDEKKPDQLGFLNKPKGEKKPIMIDKSGGGKDSKKGSWMDGKAPGKKGEGKVRLDPRVQQGDAQPSFIPTKKKSLNNLTLMKAVGKTAKRRKKANV